MMPLGVGGAELKILSPLNPSNSNEGINGTCWLIPEFFHGTHKPSPYRGIFVSSQKLVLGLLRKNVSALDNAGVFQLPDSHPARIKLDKAKIAVKTSIAGSSIPDGFLLVMSVLWARLCWCCNGCDVCQSIHASRTIQAKAAITRLCAKVICLSPNQPRSN